jgi:hypothetical protein
VSRKVQPIRISVFLHRPTMQSLVAFTMKYGRPVQIQQITISRESRILPNRSLCGLRGDQRVVADEQGRAGRCSGTETPSGVDVTRPTRHASRSDADACPR